MYRVTWTDADGYKQRREFHTRFSAVLWLNKLILDGGHYDAKLRYIH